MKYTIKPCRAVFTRRGYEVQLLNDDGSAHTRYLRIAGRPNMLFPDSEPVRFYGADGRKVRAEALAFARSYGARRAV